MSWKFAGFIFDKDYGTSYPDLLSRLEVEFCQSAGGHTFSEAISYENRSTALGVVNGKTMVLNHLLPYDCSYEPGEEGWLDGILKPLSAEGDILNYIVDGVSGTYCFSLFRNGERIRRWATEPGNVLCNEGNLIEGEVSRTSKKHLMDGALPRIFVMSEDEAHLFAVWEAFVGVSFRELVQNDTPLFYFFF